MLKAELGSHCCVVITLDALVAMGIHHISIPLLLHRCVTFGCLLRHVIFMLSRFGLLYVWKRAHILIRILLHHCQEVSFADYLVIATNFIQVIYVAGQNRAISANYPISIWVSAALTPSRT